MSADVLSGTRNPYAGSTRFEGFSMATQLTNGRGRRSATRSGNSRRLAVALNSIAVAAEVGSLIVAVSPTLISLTVFRLYRSRSRSRKRCSSFRFSSRLSRSHRDFLSRGVRPSLAMRRDSPARTSSRALFIFATIWKRSRICKASEHFSRMTFKW